jgi:hypothetical protein
MTAPARNSVIEFPAARVRPSTPRDPGEHSADVVFFTGVRIERLPDDGQSLPKPKSGLPRKRRSGRP